MRGSREGRYTIADVRDFGEPAQASCMFCGRPTYDPDKKSRPWSRAVAGGKQVLVCPECQAERPDWAANLDRCEQCGSTRLSVILGEVTCRQCGHIALPAGTSPDM